MTDNNWHIFARGTLRIERRHTPRLVDIINTYRADFTNDLQGQGQDYALSQLFLYHDESIQQALTNIYTDAGLFGAKMMARELKKQARMKDGRMGINETFIHDVIGWLRYHMVMLVQKITETMRNDIVRLLEKAAEEGWSIDDMTKELMKQDYMKARARVIARTETIRAANVGHAVAATRTPYEVSKRWSSAKDHRTRDSHKHPSLIKAVIDEDATFQVPIYKGKALIGYDEMLHPGDATASPGNTINCRCRVLYEAKRDADGRLVMRQQTAAPVVSIGRPTTSIPYHQIAAALKSNITIKPLA